MGQKPASLLFLYGPSGAGKTRLLQKIDETLDGVQGVMRKGCEQILQEMVRSLAEKSFYDCFERFSSVDNLLVSPQGTRGGGAEGNKAFNQLTQSRQNAKKNMALNRDEGDAGMIAKSKAFSCSQKTQRQTYVQQG